MKNLGRAAASFTKRAGQFQAEYRFIEITLVQPKDRKAVLTDANVNIKSTGYYKLDCR